jgi:predicted flap endonuclease-1-like 5' DNA nuclease
VDADGDDGTAAEAAEAAGPPSDEVEVADAEADADADDAEEADEGDDGDAEEEDEGAEPVEVVRGIGPAYGERLAEAGVKTVAELAEADPEWLADQVNVSESRVRRWVDRASDRR